MSAPHRWAIAVLMTVVALSSASEAWAQARRPARRPSDRRWFAISAGVQPIVSRFSDSFDRPLYTEAERIDVRYPSRLGGGVLASGGMRIGKRWAIGAGATYFTRSGPARVTAELPHPFFDNTFRHVEGSAGSVRSEAAVHVMLGAVLPLTKRMHALIEAGPSLVHVEQPVVTDVTFSESYPYDTAIFTGVRTSDRPRTAVGFHAGADLFWMWSRSIGAGGVVQFTHATVDAGAAERTVRLTAGGAYAGIGLRFIF